MTVFEGLAMVEGELKFCIAGMTVDIALTPHEKRQLAAALALSADKADGIESPPEGRFLAGDFAGSA